MPEPVLRLQIILDVSGSMAGEAGGETKMDAAKDAVLATLEALDEGTLVPGQSPPLSFLTSLRLYGHNLPREPKAASCEDTEQVIGWQPLDRDRFREVLEGVSPRGQTPIARSLREAADDFGEIGVAGAMVILVSDGEETCGGDPVAAACELKEQGFDLTVNTVGFDVGAEARGQLEGIAECTGGEYRDAGNADALGESLRELTAASLLIEKERQVQGQPIRGGNGYDDAVPLGLGTLYHLDHHQREGDFDYFTVEVGSGQKLVATITSYEEAVCIEGDEVIEGCGYSGAGIGVHGPDQSVIEYEDTKGGSSVDVSVAVPIGTDGMGTYYVVVGPKGCLGRNCDQHMASPFRLEVVDMFDAGHRYTGAVDIEPGRYTGWLHANDHTDFYRFEGRAGAAYGVMARPTQSGKELVMELTDRDGVILEEAGAPNPGAAVRIEGFVPEDDGNYFVKVAAGRRGNDLESDYALELSGPGASPADDEEASQEDGDDSGFSPLLLVLGLVVVIAAVAGGVLFRRRTT